MAYKDNIPLSITNKTDRDEREIRMNMSPMMANQIHEEYVKASASSCRNAVEVEEVMEKSLEKLDDEGTIVQTEKDQVILDYFMDKLHKSILARKQTFQATNLCTELLHAFIYLVAWLNKKYEANIDANITARRKSLESELAKMLSLADDLSPSQISDRFGIRFILDEGIGKCCFLLQKLLNIICNLDRKDRKNFLEFIEQYDEATIYRIKKLFEIPFILAPLIRKDDPSEFNPTEFYDEAGNPTIDLPSEKDKKLVSHLDGNIKFYFDPKKNGYQSIHIILMIDPTSQVLPGFQIEIQIRTWKMHMHAENNIRASHDVHKDKVNLYTQLFTLSEEELQGTTTMFFNSYKDNQNDVDGIHFPKEFYNRRMNILSI